MNSIETEIPTILIVGKNHNYYLIRNYMAGQFERWDVYREKFSSFTMKRIGNELDITLSRKLVAHYEKHGTFKKGDFL